MSDANESAGTPPSGSQPSGTPPLPATGAVTPPPLLRRPRGPGRSSAPPTTSIDLSSIISPKASEAPAAAASEAPASVAAATDASASASTPADLEREPSAPSEAAPIAAPPLSWTAHLNADAEAARADEAASASRSKTEATEPEPAPAETAAPSEPVEESAPAVSAEAVTSAPHPLVEPAAPNRASIVSAAPTVAAAAASVPRPQPAVPSGPPPLVEPPVPERKAFTAELATQAMSLQEIADAKAAPRGVVPWTRSVPTAKPADAAGDAAELSTQAMSLAEVAEVAKPAEVSTQAMSLAEVAEAEKGPDRPVAASPMTGLFARAETARNLPALPVAPPTSGAGIQRSAIHPPMPRGQKILLGIVGGLVLVLVLVAVYLLASRLGEQSVTADITSEETAAPVETAAPELAGGPVAPGEYEWSELLGGECIQPFESAWAEEFTVVACDAEHAAQVLLRGELTEATSVAYPGEEALAEEVATLCSAPEVLNYSAAGVMADIQISSSYPANSTDWDAGNRAFFCFVDRTSGEAIPGDLRVPVL